MARAPRHTNASAPASDPIPSSSPPKADGGIADAADEAPPPLADAPAPTTTESTPVPPATAADANESGVVARIGDDPEAAHRRSIAQRAIDESRRAIESLKARIAEIGDPTEKTRQLHAEYEALIKERDTFNESWSRRMNENQVAKHDRFEACQTLLEEKRLAEAAIDSHTRRIAKIREEN